MRGVAPLATLALLLVSLPSAADPPPPMHPEGDSEVLCRTDGVVGRTRCRGQGRRRAGYARNPPLQVRGAVSMHHYPISMLRFGPGAEALKLPDTQVGLSTPAATLRVALTGDLLHVGLEGSYSSHALDRAPIPGPGVMLDLTHAVYASGGPVAGLALRLGDLVVRGEVLVGGRHTSVLLVDRWSHMATLATDAAWVVEPRVSVEAYLSPWVALGVWAGTDLVAEAAGSYGLFLEVKALPWDGARR